MKAENLKKSYGGRCVLELDALELEKGKIYAVIGANGCGKSTLARLLAGTESPDGKGACLPKVKVGYMPQKSYAFRMNTKRNLCINRDEDDRSEELLKKLGLEHLEKSSAKKLSGGETARMAMARLLMKDYELLILDEPTAAMDEESTLTAEKLLLEYREKCGCTVLIITHELNQAQRLADEILFLKDGKAVEKGSPEKLLYEPDNDETKRFVEFYSIKRNKV